MCVCVLQGAYCVRMHMYVPVPMCTPVTSTPPAILSAVLIPERLHWASLPSAPALLSVSRVDPVLAHCFTKPAPGPGDPGRAEQELFKLKISSNGVQTC